MSTTTEILFNSPALHSLKRDQLVKLCKIHALKANGKNVELVERLKTHAKNLPNDNPLSVAFRSEQEGAPETQDDEADRPWMPRPSSQWEVVMDSIMEESEDGSSQGTLSSLKSGTTFSGEFGADSGSSKSTTVSSSIRALASSLGLKRHATGGSTASSKSSAKLISSFPLPPSADELTKNSTPYDALPPSSSTNLQTDHFTFDTSDPAVVAAHLNPHLGTAPLPGHSLRPGVPAPINARLSLGLAPRTPSKRGPTTTIRLVSMDATAPKAKLPPQGGTPNLKPFQTTFDLDLGSPSAAPAFPQSIYPALPASPPVDEEARRMSLEASQHISLGTEMDEDKNEDVPMPGAFGFGANPSTPPNTAKPSFMFGSPSPQPVQFSFQMASPGMATKAKLAADVMEEMNRRAFGESGVGETLPPTAAREIRPLPGSARKAGSNAKPSGRFSNVHQQMFEKMESIADLAAKREGLKRKSSAMSIRVANTAAAKEPEQGRGKRVRVDEAGSDKRSGEADDEEAAAEKKKQAEREAMRKKLEISRARRRSSAANGGARRMSGRVSGVLVKPKPAPRGRFGFFAGAAKLVQGVWGGKKAAPPAPSASAASTTQKPASGVKPPVAGPSKMGPPPVPSARASADTKSLRPPSVRSMASTRSTTASRARSPLPPSFIGTSSSKSTASSARTRNSSIAGASSVGTRTSSASGSMGTRSSLNIGSLGTRGSFSSTNTPGSTVDSTRKTASRPLSRLLAPTASSLAKMNVSPSSPLPAVVEKQGARVLEGITNTTAASEGAAAAIAPAAPATAKGKAKLLPAPARKPRISRSRVIAKLASQRVASGSSVASASTAASASRKSLATGRTRSSLGTKVQRGSLGGIRNGPGGPLDAKRRARQSEYYARRRSRVEQAQADTMQVEP